MELPKFFKEGRKPKLEEELGESGTYFYSGSLVDTDYNQELTGYKALKTYDEMRKSDGIIGAMLLACELPIRAATFYIEPASDDKKDLEIAEFLEYNLFRGMSITWDDFLRQALLMLPFGFYPFEKVYKIIEYNGRQYIGWKKFAPRLPETVFAWKNENGEDGIVQMLNNGKRVFIPIEKLLIFTFRKEGDNWQGTSILRNAYRSWFFKQHIEKINAIALERQGVGIPEATLPPNHTKEDVDKAKEILKNLRANEKAFLIKPAGWEIKFMDMGGNSVINPMPSIIRYNREMLTSILAQFLDLGSTSTGSRALSVDQTTTFHNNLTAIAKQICDVINNYAIKQLVDFNFEVEKYPELKFTHIGRVDYQELATSLQSLALAGIITPSPELEDYVRDNMGLPDKPEEEVEQQEQPKETKTSEKFQEKTWIPPRPLTFAENKIKWNDLRLLMESQEKELSKEIKRILADIQNDLISQVHRIWSTTDVAQKRELIKNLKTKHQALYRQVIYQGLKKMFDTGKEYASQEMKKEIPKTSKEDLINISNNADALLEAMDSDLTKETKFAIISALEGKRFQEVPITTALAVVGKAIKEKVKKIGDTIPSIIVSKGINQGRRSLFEIYDNDIYAVQRSEILDDRICPFCEAIDGKVFKKDDPMTKEDGFHSNCRGLWVEIMMDEFEKPQITGISDSLKSQYKGFM